MNWLKVGDIKNKWKTGGVETAEQKETEGKAELEALKVLKEREDWMNENELQAGGVSVKERFQEGKEAGGDVKKWDRSMLDTSCNHFYFYSRNSEIKTFFGMILQGMIKC